MTANVEKCQEALEEAAAALSRARANAPNSARFFCERIEDAQDTTNVVLDDVEHYDEW